MQEENNLESHDIVSDFPEEKKPDMNEISTIEDVEERPIEEENGLSDDDIRRMKEKKKSNKTMKDFFDGLKDFLKDITIAFIIILIIMTSLFVYSGHWPPVVVVESRSMQHNATNSSIGIIDTGDMAIVKEVKSLDDITTYDEAEQVAGKKMFGSYGDVIIYRPNGLENTTGINNETISVTPIIHRAIVWLEVNDSRVQDFPDRIDYENYTFDVPSRNLYGTTGNLIFENYGFSNTTLIINLTHVIAWYELEDKEPHSGFITGGDFNIATNSNSYDQVNFRITELVKVEWVISKASVEIPWFGIIKLMSSTEHYSIPENSKDDLTITIIAIIALPVVLETVIAFIMKKREGPEIQSSEKEDEISNDENKERLKNIEMNDQDSDLSNIDNEIKSEDMIQKI